MKRIHVVQLVLFVLTVLFTIISGAEWRYGKSFIMGDSLTLSEIGGGVAYSFSFLLIIGVHEFGHYFYAVKNNVKVTFPFFIPMYLGIFPSFGSMGAFIQIKSQVPSRRVYFDIGAAGPIAGFVLTVIVIISGFLTLPSLDYLFQIHPEYFSLGENYAQYVPPSDQSVVAFKFGPTLLFTLLENVLPYNQTFYPISSEVIHYPLLMVGYLALFFTSLNLLPIGQLDGGHIIYGLFGKKLHGIISRVFFIGFLFYAGIGFMTPGAFDFNFFLFSLAYIYFLYVCLFHVTTDIQAKLMIAVAIFTVQFLLVYFFPGIKGYPGWLFMALFVGRIVGVDHPETEDEKPLDLKRKLIGVLCLVIFVLSISPTPFIAESINPEVDESTEDESAFVPFKDVESTQSNEL